MQLVNIDFREVVDKLIVGNNRVGANVVGSVGSVYPHLTTG